MGRKKLPDTVKLVTRSASVAPPVAAQVEVLAAARKWTVTATNGYLIGLAVNNLGIIEAGPAETAAAGEAVPVKSVAAGKKGAK